MNERRDDDEILGARLRRVLGEEAELMIPSDDGLQQVRGRLAQEERRTPRWLAPLAAAAAVLLVAAGVTFFVTRDDGGTGPASSPSPTATGGSVSPSPSPTASTGEQITVPVYYVVDVDGVGPRLYREFHRVAEVTGGPIPTALGQMFANTPADPDYSSPWPTSTKVLSVTPSGSTATVDLSGFVSLGAAFESAAVQQLVYTVTAADPTVTSVRLLVNGAAPPSGHSDWSAPISRAPALGTVANVWILAPEQGTTVGSPVTVSVYGTGWEGNVPLKVFQGATEVASTFVTTEMGGFREASTTITLSPGAYQLRAYNDNGKDASLQLWDTKDFTVQ